MTVLSAVVSKDHGVPSEPPKPSKTKKKAHSSRQNMRRESHPFGLDLGRPCVPIRLPLRPCLSIETPVLAKKNMLCTGKLSVKQLTVSPKLALGPVCLKHKGSKVKPKTSSVPAFTASRQGHKITL